MKTKAVRIYGANDLRLEEFELPEMREDEILAKVISDSVCMSSHKAALQGSAHARVPNDIAENPTIIGHEFCGEIIAVGEKWQSKFKAGDKFAIQPAIGYQGKLDAPGYSYRFIGGNSQYVVIPNEVMECNCLLPYHNDAYFYGSLAEPVSCIIGGYHTNYHTNNSTHLHTMGIVEGGNAILMAAAGPMGLGAIDYAIHCDRKPALLVVTDIDNARLDRAASIITVEEAAKNGVKLVYVNTNAVEDAREYLMSLTDGKGYDDAFVYAPVKPVVELADSVLGFDGCLNFFAGPTNPAFSAMFNFYNVHYSFTHVCGNSGGNTDDMIEAIDMMSDGRLNPTAMITHVGGLDAVVDTVINLDKIPGGKKLIYNFISMPLVALADLAKLGETDPLYRELALIVEKNNGLWCAEAEKYLLANAKQI
ncbi:MAG: zinc-binding dehydrogenase [Clostridia bacterium]|nr:zinc-binding dehydrogenase [Clostridia bacterium]